MEARNGKPRGRGSNRYVCTIRASIALSPTFMEKNITLFLKNWAFSLCWLIESTEEGEKERNCRLWLVEIDGIYQLFMDIAIALFATARSLLLFKAKSGQINTAILRRKRGGKATQAKNKA